MLDHRTVSLADQVYDALETDILSGKYARGDLLTENKLCEIMGVSRTPVREALRRLGQENLIKESGKGSVVVGINENDLDDIFAIRLQIEGIAAQKAALNASAEEIEQLRSALEMQEFFLAKNNAEEIKTMDNRFHETLYAISGSVTFYNILLSLHKKVQKYRKASIQKGSRAFESVEEHKQIFDAIVSRDAEAAKRYAISHVQNAYNHIVGKDK